MDKPSDWDVLTQRFDYHPEGWVKHYTQLLVENNPIAGFVHILLNAGLYINQHFLECRLEFWISWVETSLAVNRFWVLDNFAD